MPGSDWEETLVDGGESFKLVRRRGKIVLVVSCGTIALYLIYLGLNEAEIVRYEQEGASFLTVLASRVTRNPDAYRGRDVRNLE